VALPSDSVAFSGSFVPPSKSNVEKLDVIVEVVLVIDVVVDKVPAALLPLSRVFVEPVDVPVDVDPLDRIVAAPAAMTQRRDNPTPTMEPVSLIFIFATPAIKPP
jgi:hypothetical protein